MVGSPCRRSGSSLKAFAEVCEAHPEVREWLGGPSLGSGVVERPTWRFWSGREVHLEVQEWSGGPLGGPGVVGRPSRRSGSGREALREVRQWSEGCP